MAGREIEKEIDLNNIGQELREETARWLGEKYGPEITEEEIDLYKLKDFHRDQWQ